MIHKSLAWNSTGLPTSYSIPKKCGGRRQPQLYTLLCWFPGPHRSQESFSSPHQALLGEARRDLPARHQLSSSHPEARTHRETLAAVSAHGTKQEVLLWRVLCFPRVWKIQRCFMYSCGICIHIYAWICVDHEKNALFTHKTLWYMEIKASACVNRNIHGHNCYRHKHAYIDHVELHIKYSTLGI